VGTALLPSALPTVGAPGAGWVDEAGSWAVDDDDEDEAPPRLRMPFGRVPDEWDGVR